MVSNIFNINTCFYMVFQISISFLITILILPLLRYIALTFHFVDRPDGVLKKHALPIPHCGGIALLFSTVFGLLITSFFTQVPRGVMSFACIAIMLGMYDDFYRIKPIIKFSFQAFIVLLISLFYLKNLSLDMFAAILCIIWCLVLMNAFNLIDIMDGLLGTVLVWITLFLSILFYHQIPWYSHMLMVISGSLLGFLVYNLPPASIYMGESGALYLGAILGILPIQLMQARFFSGSLSAQFYAMVPFLGVLFFIPLFELISLIIIRSMKGIPFYQGSPHHFALYLQSFGLKKEHILLLVSGLSLLMLVILFKFFL